MRLSKNTKAAYDWRSRTWDNEEGYVGHHRYQVSKKTACADVKVTPAQFDVLKRAIQMPHGLAAFAVKGNVLKNMIAAGLVELVSRPWGAFDERTDVVTPTDKGRAAYRIIAEAA